MIPGPRLRAFGRVAPSRLLARAGVVVLAAALVAATPAPGNGAIPSVKSRAEAGPSRLGQGNGQSSKKRRRQPTQGVRRILRRGKSPLAAPVTGPIPRGPGKKPRRIFPAKAKAGKGAGKKPLPEALPVAPAPAASSAVAPAAALPVPVAAPTPDEPARTERKTRRKAAKEPSERRRPQRRGGAVRADGASGGGAPVVARPAGGRAPAPATASIRRAKAVKKDDGGGSPVAPVAGTVRDIVEVVPEPIKVLLAALGILSLVLGGVYTLTAARARRLARQRSDLLQEVGLLQTALLPPVPATVGAVRTSVAYQPSDGPGAGGDFYDALTLPGGRAAFILGDVSGHGRQALARTAFMRYTMRAYLEAGLEPRVALQVAGRVVDDHLGGDFATVVLAVHDPQSGSITYACAGHPAPIIVGPTRPEPVLAASSPPIGLGLRTGVRQTTAPLPPGSVVCLYTDGLAEARTERGVLGRPRLGDIVAELGRDVTAQELLDHVASEARLVSDDMATVVLTPTAGVTAGGFRSEQLELDADEVGSGLGRQFLEACGCERKEIADVTAEAEHLAARHGGAVLHVRYGVRGPRAEALPRNVESLEAASLRIAASSA